jgi:hypothetical protein
MCGHAHLAREIFLANSRLGTEPADLIAFGGTLSVCAHVCAHEGISKQLPNSFPSCDGNRSEEHHDSL